MASLVLIHGFTGAPESWNLVRRQLHAPAHTVVVAPHVAGHGHESSWPNLNPGFGQEVDRLAQLMTDVPAPRVVCGYSLGGRLALGLLAEHNLFEAAVLVGAHPGLTTASERAERKQYDARWINMLERPSGLQAFVAAWSALPMWNSMVHVPQPRRRHLAKVRAGHSATGLAFSLRNLGLAEMPNYRPYLEATTTPIELVVGELDEKFAKLARALAAKNPRVQMRLAPDAGHNLLYEAPHFVAQRCEALMSEVFFPRNGDGHDGRFG